MESKKEYNIQYKEEDVICKIFNIYNKKNQYIILHKNDEFFLIHSVKIYEGEDEDLENWKSYLTKYDEKSSKLFLQLFLDKKYYHFTVYNKPLFSSLQLIVMLIEREGGL